MITTELKNKIKELYRSTPDYVGVAHGYKITNNQITDIEAIVFLVPVKKPIHLLSSDEILPTEPIQLSDRTLQMDVVEVGEIRTQACNASCYSWQTSPPANRLFRRPLQGGISITSTNWLGYVGTLGFVAVDSQTQSLVGVTNAHVVIKDPTDASSRNLNGVIQNEYLVTSGTSTIPDLIYQPGEFPNPPNSYIVGQVVRYIPLYLTATTRAIGSTIENKVDGALVSLSGTPILSLTESYKQYGITDITNPLPFATTQELDDILSLNPLLKSSGRTTGVKNGGDCPLRVFYDIASVPVGGYNAQGIEVVVDFDECVGVIRPFIDPIILTACTQPTAGGDSGSAFIGEFSGTGLNKIVGLNFAGSLYFAWFNRIDNVASELGIEAWDGSLKNLVDTSTVEFRTISGGISGKTATCGGNTYWQVGLTTLNNPCV